MKPSLLSVAFCYVTQKLFVFSYFPMSSGFTEAERLALLWKKQQKEQAEFSGSSTFVSREKPRKKSPDYYGKSKDEELGDNVVDEFGRTRRTGSDRQSSKPRYLEERRDRSSSRLRHRSSSRSKDPRRRRSTSRSRNRDHNRADRIRREEGKEEFSWKHDLFNQKDEERYIFTFAVSIS
jgi:hypothetical protein